MLLALCAAHLGELEQRQTELLLPVDPWKLFFSVIFPHFPLFDGVTGPIAGAKGVLKIYEPGNCSDQMDNHVRTTAWWERLMFFFQKYKFV